MLQICFSTVKSLIREIFKIMTYRNNSRHAIMLSNGNKIIFVRNLKNLGYTFMLMNMSYKFKVVRKITLNFTLDH